MKMKKYTVTLAITYFGSDLVTNAIEAAYFHVNSAGVLNFISAEGYTAASFNSGSWTSVIELKA